MKNKNIKYLLVFCITIFTVFATGCDEKEQEPIIEKIEVNDLTLESDSIRVEVGAVTTIQITDGNSDYKAFALNEDIIEVSLADNALKIKGLKNGKTNVILSDKEGQYKSLEVISFYSEIILDQDEINIKMPLGNFKSKDIEIKGGNGGYEVSSDDGSVATAEVSGEKIVVTGFKEGSTIINVVDVFGIKKSFTVNVVTTLEPFTEEELSEMKENAERRYMFDGDQQGSEWFTYLNKEEDGFQVYGWDYWGMHLKLYFKGDKSVGKKTEAKMSYNESWSGDPMIKDVDLEIIKNDGENIWAIFSYVENEKLYFGYFVDTIEP